MPASCSIDAARGLILTRCEGVLTDAEIMDLKREIHSDPAFDPTFRELTDLRAVTELKVSSKGVASFSGFDRDVGDGHRIAMVASEAVVFGMARMYQQVTVDGDRVGVFRSMEEALDFLGIEAPG